jgi:hypothetical protein
MAKQSKEQRIKREISRLNKIYKDLPEDYKKLSIGLIERFANLRIALEDLEKDLDVNGYVELFTQSEKIEPYERERPAARIYPNYLARYTAIHKQLSNLLPDKAVGDDDEDEFKDF